MENIGDFYEYIVRQFMFISIKLFLGYEIDKPFKISMKTSNAEEYFE